jgi:hypothetical protein
MAAVNKNEALISIVSCKMAKFTVCHFRFLFELIATCL